MAFSVNDLRERRKYVAKNARELLNGSADKEWTPDLQQQYDNLIAEIDGIDARITNAQKIADRDAEKAFENASVNVSESTIEGVSPRQVFNTWARRGAEGMTQEQVAAFRNVMSTTTGSQGGHTVPTEISQMLIDSLKGYGAMRAVSTVIATSDGKPLSFPTSDGTSETGEWIAQNTTSTNADPTFGTVSVNVFKASSKDVAAPIELLQDSVIDIEAFIMARLAQRLGRLTNTAFTVGTGTTQPDGVVPRSSVGKTGTTGQTLTIIVDDIIDLIHSVDPAYRSNRCCFMANDALVRVIRKLKDGQQRPIWTPNDFQGIQNAPNGGGNGGYAAQDRAVPYDLLMGYPLYVNNDMASPAANARTLLFGDFSKYMIRDAMDVTMFRFTDSAYSKLGQVGFLAWMRTGGNLVDTAAVKHYAHSAT
jgi:HK97 family phage major capsid protein